jgi:hypothetical protein
MSIQLLAVTFNHDPAWATHDALNLRRNATEFVDVPEWRRGACVNPEDSPAAYATVQVRGHVVTIQAKFRTTDPGISHVEIRALDADIDPPGPPGCLGLFLRILRSLFRTLFGNVLGEVAPAAVPFAANGESTFESFTLRYTRLDWARVGAYATRWRWQYRLTSSHPWQDFDLSQHRIYVVHDIPTAPWQQSPYAASNTQLPWTEVLDHACAWAFGAATAEEAARGVTRGVYETGPATLTYDCPGGGSSHYSYPSFDCTAFLERLGGGPGNGWYVNCSDCATFVATFANALGCDLWQSRMGWGFGLNPLLGIGASVWQPACGWSGFSYHEVAWTGACDVNDRVFDACLQVDADADPTSAPHWPELPCDMRFGDPGDGDYRDRLATPAGAPNCDPQPATRQRRAVL